MRFSRPSPATTAVLLALLSACDGPRDGLSPDGLPSSAQLDHASTSACIEGATSLMVSIYPNQIEVGQQAVFYATVFDGSGGTLSASTVQWSISDTTVASPSTEASSGRSAAIGKRGGTVTVTANCGSIASTATVTVGGGTTTNSAMSVVVSLPTTQLTPGQTTQAQAQLQDAGGQLSAATSTTWSTSDANIARVSDQGVVTAVANGTATVSATVNGLTGGASVSVASSGTPTSPTPPTSVDPGSGVTAVTPELPRASVDARYVAPTGRTINVPSGGDLQGAINSAGRGDAILLEPGATYYGPITLPAKPGSGWITIRTAGSLPGEGQRMTPSYAGQLPKIVGGGANAAVMLTTNGASGYRVVGVELTADPSIVNLTSIVELGEGGGYYQRSLSDVPTDLVLDRVYVHGQSGTNLQRCIALNSARTAIVNSWIAECHGRGLDAQAIAGWNGPGPYLIENNQLEGSGENIMFGGADAVIYGLSPSDITIRRNHIRKPPEWRGVWLVKNLFELKHAKRVLVEGNVFENNWADAQTGMAIVLKSTNQGGTNPWAQTADVTMRYNVIRNSPQGINIAGV